MIIFVSECAKMWAGIEIIRSYFGYIEAFENMNKQHGHVSADGKIYKIAVDIFP